MELYTDEREARMLLTHLTEPGDLRFTELVKDVGPTLALEFMLEVTLEKMSVQHRRMAEYLRGRLPSVPMCKVAKRAADKGITFIMPGDPSWPSQLDELAAPPFGLWVRGAMPSLSYSVAVVGARAATSYGEHAALSVGEGLARSGVIVVSGAAYGIDGAAHRGAIVGGGQTVAFLAGGVDRPYPSGHAELIERIVEAEGALASEVAPGTAPTKYRFLARNRLIAASRVMFLIEAGARSGSLNAVSHAEALGRPVLALPGPVTSVASVGANALIRDGRAKLAVNAADAFRALRDA